MNRTYKTDGIHSLGNASREAPLTLPQVDFAFAPVDCSKLSKPWGLASHNRPGTRYHQTKGGKNLSMVWSKFPGGQAYSSHHQIVIWICF